MEILELVLLLIVLVPIWAVALIFVYLDARDAFLMYRNERRARKLIESLDIGEPLGRERLGIRQEEE